MMYEKWKEEILNRISKQFDKEVNDEKSYTMEKILAIDGFRRNPVIDDEVRKYFNMLLRMYGTFTWKIPTKRILELFDKNAVRKETPKLVLKANLFYRYWHHYFKKYYNDIMNEAKIV